MSQVCDFCARRGLSSIKRSHSNIASKNWQKVNLQKVTLNGKTYKVCAKCLKSLAKADSKVST